MKTNKVYVNNIGVKIRTNETITSKVESLKFVAEKHSKYVIINLINNGKSIFLEKILAAKVSNIKIISNVNDMQYWVKDWMEYQLKITLNQDNIKALINEIPKRKAMFDEMIKEHEEKKCDCKIGDYCLANMYLCGEMSFIDALFDFEL